MRNEQQQLMERMVDGELGVQQQRQLLLDCEHEDRWRELALAYVEAQAFASELKTYATEPMPSKETAPSERSPRRGTEHPPGSAIGWGPWSLAAAVMLSLSLGYGAGWWWQPGSDYIVDSKTGPVASQELSANGDGTPPVQSPRSMQFTVSNPVTNEFDQIQLPLVKASDLRPGWEEQLHGGIPEQLQRELNKGGLHMEQTRTVMPVRLKDGRRVIVPVDYFVERPFQ